MTYLEYLDDQQLTDLWLEDEDDMALIIGAIKPWHLDGQPLSNDLEQWFIDNWNAPENVRHAIPFGA